MSEQGMTLSWDAKHRPKNLEEVIGLGTSREWLVNYMRSPTYPKQL